LHISTGKILSISPELNFTPNDLGCYGLKSSTYSEELSHLVGGGLPVVITAEAMVENGALFTVAVVGGLDDVKGLGLVRVLARLGDQLRVALEDVFGEGRDVVEDLALASDGVLHGLVDGLFRFVGGQLVEAGVDEVLGPGVDLELADDTLDHVDLPFGHLSVDDDALDDAVAELDDEGLVGHLELLPLERLLVDGGAPSAGQSLVDIGVLGLGELGVQLVLGGGVQLKSSPGDHAGVLVSDLVESGQGATLHLVRVFGVGVPCLDGRSRD